MNKTIKILLLALILQVFLTVVVYFASGIVSSPSDPELLFKIKKDQISKVLLFGPSNKKVVLEKIEDDWLLPENSNFPANEAQINQLLDRLLETKLGSKISQQKSSHSRLRVSDSEYERKVSIFGNNDFESTVFFGSAPSLRQSHARILNKKNVHVVKFSANDIDIQSNDWLKKDIFVLPKKNIKSVFFKNLKFDKVMNQEVDNAETDSNSGNISKERWEVTGLKNKKYSIEAVDNFIKNIADMQINGIATESSIKMIDKSKKPIKFTVLLSSGKKITYELAELLGEEDFLMFTSERDGAYRLPPLSGKELLLSANPEILLGNKLKDSN